MTNPRSGLSFYIKHSHEGNEDCPIAQYEEDGAMVGLHLYPIPSEAIKSWNTRV